MVHSKDDPKLSYQIIVPTLPTPRRGGGWLLFRECRVLVCQFFGSFSCPSILGQSGSQRILSPDSPVVVQKSAQRLRWKERRRTVVWWQAELAGGGYPDSETIWYVQEHIQKRAPDPDIKWWKNLKNPYIYIYIVGLQPRWQTTHWFSAVYMGGPHVPSYL